MKEINLTPHRTFESTPEHFNTLNGLNERKANDKSIESFATL